MKKIMLLITLQFCFFGFSQANKCTKQEIKLNNKTKYLLLITEGNQTIYSGVFDLSHSLPTGMHHLYNSEGQIQRLIEYSFSKVLFEGDPIVIQKTYFFNKNQELEKVVQAERCNECEYVPTGIWEFYKKGILIKTINAEKRPNLEHELYEPYWKLMENCN